MKPSIDSLLTGLQDEDPYKRMVAAESLGSFEDNGSTEALIDALWDPLPDVRRVVIRSLSVQRDPRAITPLLHCLKDMEVHNAAAKALLSFIDAKHLPCFIEALSDETPAVRKVAATLIGKFQSDEALNSLCSATKDEDWTVRRAALESLVHFSSSRAVESLIEGLEDDIAQIRLSAAQMLELFKDPVAIAPLVRSLRSESSFVRKTAILALGGIEEPSVIPILARSLEDPSKEVRTAASQALSHRDEPVVIDVLIKALKHSDSDLSLLAAKTLQLVPPERVAPAIVEALADADFHHRLHGFEILSQINYPISVLPLIHALGDNNAKIRSIAASTLRNHSPTEVIPALIDALIQDEIEDQGAAVELLGTLDHPDIVPPLLKAMRSEIPIARARAADALEKYAHPIPYSDLIDLLDHPSISHRKLVTRLLGKCQDSQAVQTLIQLLKDDPAPEVRIEAIVALGQYQNELAVKGLTAALLSPHFHIRTPARKALEGMPALHALTPLLENLARWDSEVFSIPAELMISLYLEGKRDIALAISDALFFHLQPRNKSDQVRLHLSDVKGRHGLDALKLLLEQGEWRHLAFFANRELAGIGYMILRMIRILNATHNLQKLEADQLVCKEHLSRFNRIKKKRDHLPGL